MSLLGGQNRSKIDAQNGVLKMIKNVTFGRVKNRLNFSSKITFQGGVPGGLKMSKIDVWDPGGQFINFR
jgi:hypothetical protein